MGTGGIGWLIVCCAFGSYLLLELWIAIRDGWGGFKDSIPEPGAVRLTIAFAISWPLGVAFAAFDVPPELPGSSWVWLAVGVAVIYVAVALRLWAVLTLGRFFRRVVVIQEGHRVVTAGPYRFARHPAYTGILLAHLGLGIALANVLSIAVLVALPAIALRARIAEEEEALEDALGDEYRAYAARTRRLVPGLW